MPGESIISFGLGLRDLNTREELLFRHLASRGGFSVTMLSDLDCAVP